MSAIDEPAEPVDAFCANRFEEDTLTAISVPDGQAVSSAFLQVIVTALDSPRPIVPGSVIVRVAGAFTSVKVIVPKIVALATPTIEPVTVYVPIGSPASESMSM